MLLPPAEPSVQVEVERAEALLRAGRLRDAAAGAEQIAERSDGSTRRQALLIQVEALRWAHALDADAVKGLEATADEPGCPPVEAARVLSVAATGWLHLWNADRGLALARRALAAADEAGDPSVRSLALGALGKALVVTGQPDEGEQLVAEAAPLAWDSDDPFVHLGPGLSMHIDASIVRGDFAPATEAMAAQLRCVERLGLVPAQVKCHGLNVIRLAALGHWDEAPAAVETWWHLAVANDIHLTSPSVCSRVSRMVLGQGDLEGTATWLERGERLAAHQAIPKSIEPPLALARGLWLEATGQPGDALDHLRDAWRRLRDVPFTHFIFAVPLARLAVDAGDLVTAQAAADGLRDAPTPALRQPQLPFRVALAQAVAGGPVDPALDAFHALEPERLIKVDHLLDQETLADVLADRGRRDEGVRLLHDATDAWEEIGAPFFAARTLAKLRALGVRRGARGSRDRPATGWEALTPTERQVADLILDGLTYREIGERQWISRRTVETHARHIFAKLGVANRRELASLAARPAVRPAAG